MKQKEYNSISEIEKDLKDIRRNIKYLYKDYINKQESAIQSFFVSDDTADTITKERIQESLSIIEKYELYANTIKSIYLKFVHDFTEIPEEEKSEVIRKILVLRQQLKEYSSDISSRISGIAKVYCPKELKKTKTRIKRVISKKLKYESVKISYFIYPQNEGVLYVCFLNFNGLKDNNNYENPNFYLTVSKHDDTFYIGLSPKKLKKVEDLRESDKENIEENVLSMLEEKNFL